MEKTVPCLVLFCGSDFLIKFISALKCYECTGYQNGKYNDQEIEEHPYELRTSKNCYSNGALLEQKFVVDCQVNGDGYIPVCLKTHLEIQVNQTSEDRNTKPERTWITRRHCERIPITTKTEYSTGCQGSFTVKKAVEFTGNDRYAKARIKALYNRHGLTEESSIGFCACYKDLCNGASYPGTGREGLRIGSGLLIIILAWAAKSI